MNHANVLDDDFRAVINYTGKTSNRIKAETVDHGQPLMTTPGIIS